MRIYSKQNKETMIWASILFFLIVLLGAMFSKGCESLQKMVAEQEQKILLVEASTKIVTDVANQAIPNEELLDSWGNKLRIKKESGAWDTVTVTSAGPDFAFDTEDDVSYTKSSSINFGQAVKKVFQSRNVFSDHIAFCQGV